MSELANINDYGQFKEALGTELRNQAAGFVRTGYLLKVARDTDILKDSGYTTVAEFAQAEYGLSKDIVSRYIAINDRYSENGYSEKLMEKYEGYGIAKLQEMLTLPDAVVDLINPDMTKREIQEIKKEVKEEEKISDMEVWLEGKAPEHEAMTDKQTVIYQLFHDNREKYVEFFEKIENITDDDSIKKIADILAPSGMAVYSVRIQGVGKKLVSIKGIDKEIEILNIRTNEKEYMGWKELLEEMILLFGDARSESGWEYIYNEPYRAEEKTVENAEKPQVAPVQLVSDEPKEEKEAEQTEETHNVLENVAESSQSVSEIEENVCEVEDNTGEVEEIKAETEPIDVEIVSEEDIQVPGQTNIADDFPEWLPDSMAKEVEKTENVEKTESDSEHWSGNNNIKRGYVAAVTNNLNKLVNLWNGDSENKISEMIKVAEDMNWRLTRLKEMEE